MNESIPNLDEIKVAKPVKVKAWDSCEQVADNLYRLEGQVSMAEAKMMENILRLSRKPAGTLEPDELQLVASLLTLKGRR